MSLGPSIVNHQEFIPHPQLRREVKALWWHEEAHTSSTEEHTLLPDSSVELGYFSGDALLEDDAGRMQSLPSVYLLGLQDAPRRGVSRVLGVRLYAWGALRLLGLGSGLRDFQAGVGEALLEQASPILGSLEHGEVGEACTRLEAWLLERHRATALNSDQARVMGGVSAVREAGGALYTSLGQARIAALAGVLGMSVRQLERVFRRESGVAPKALARLVRFERATEALRLEPRTNLTALAYELGFADQALFTREFKAFARLSPCAFASHLCKPQPPGPR